MRKYEFRITEEILLNKFLSEKGLKHGEIRSLLKNKDIKVNNKRVKDNIKLKINDKIELFLNEELKENKVEITTIYEDENLCILLKPKNILTCGENGLEGKTNFIAVHRLDRNTEGLIIMAKKSDEVDSLKELFKNGQVVKNYICEVEGKVQFNGEIKRAYLFKDAKKSIVYVSDRKERGYKEILTSFRTLRIKTSTTIVECELLTGRTHQLRAHLSYLGHPIIGDKKYGRSEINKKYKEKTQKLFCYKLSFKEIKGKLSYLSKKEFSCLPKWAESLNI